MPKRNLPTLHNDRVRLRLLRRSDLPLTRRWRNRDDIRRWFNHSEIISAAQHARWFETYCERDDDFVWIIEDIQSGCRPVGQVSLYRIDWKSGQAEFGRLMIGKPAATGKGLAFAAAHLVLKLAFTTLALGEISLEVFADNERAINLYQRIGFEMASQAGEMRIMRISPQQFLNP